MQSVTPATYQQSPTVSSNPFHQAGSSSTSTPTAFRSVIASRKGATYNLKVVKAEMTKHAKGKVAFQPVNQTYIDLVESTANVEYILTLVQRRWGEDYIIVTNDGLQLEDSPATQGIVSIIVNVLFYNVCIIIGITFWKSPRRKIYAIHKSQKISIVSAGKHPLNIMDSDDDDFEPPPNSKRTKTENKIDKVIGEINDIKETLSDMLSITKHTQVPLGMIRILNDTFKCSICHAIPINPPVIVTKCCKRILGCESCVNTWYSGTDALVKSCPSCRAQRGYNETMLLRGLDEFMNGVKSVFEKDDEKDK